MKRRTKRIGIALLIIAGTVLLLSVFHAPVFRTAARIWVMDTTPESPVDAIIIPGGGLETRPFGAAELFHEGLSKKLVTFAAEVRPSEALGLTRPSHEVAVEVLEKLKVPAENVEVIHAAVTSTQDEVEAIQKWAAENRIHSILIVTDIFPSRRVNRAYQKGLSDLEIEISVHPVPARHFDATNWWKNEQGLIAFQNEVIKYFYYLIRY
jgi:uncharacterized SAM-binding protein YcdF (DUF218 family)